MSFSEAKMKVEGSLCPSLFFWALPEVNFRKKRKGKERKLSGDEDRRTKAGAVCWGKNISVSFTKMIKHISSKTKIYGILEQSAFSFVPATSTGNFCFG